MPNNFNYSFLISLEYLEAYITFTIINGFFLPSSIYAFTVPAISLIVKHAISFFLSSFEVQALWNFIKSEINFLSASLPSSLLLKDLNSLFAISSNSSISKGGNFIIWKWDKKLLLKFCLLLIKLSLFGFCVAIKQKPSFFLQLTIPILNH